MTTPLKLDVVLRRLRNHGLAHSKWRTPGEVVAGLGAVQAQDYAGAKWAVGLRSTGLNEASTEQAFNDGAILRTHVMRPTWHFVTSADIRWMLALTASRVNAVSAHQYRKNELDSAIFARSRAVFERALKGGQQLTRHELASALQKIGIRADGVRLACLMMRAELDGVVCSGAKRGNQFTYALLDERVPHAMMLERDEALAELTRRYFSSHGPATLRDYAWWSGLTARDARAGIEMIKPILARERADGRAYWFLPSRVAALQSPTVYLLPNYDEFGVAYKDRDVVPGAPRPRGVGATDPFAHSLLIDGRIAGRWRRTLKTSTVVIEVQPFRSLTKPERRALDAAAARYGRFMNLAVMLRI